MQMADGGGGGGYRPLTPMGKESIVNHEALKNVHKALHEDQKAYDSWGTPGTYKYLTDAERGRVRRQDLGEHDGKLYPAAEGLMQSCENAYSKISTAYNQFISSYGTLVEKIRSAAEGHAAAEQANHQTYKNFYNSDRGSYSSGDGGGGGGGGSWG